MQRRIFTYRSINLLAKRSINLWYVLIDLFFFAPINKKNSNRCLRKKNTNEIEMKKKQQKTFQIK